MKRRVAIVGAGMAGASAGRALTRQGTAVTIYEKSRGPGGRMSTRRDGTDTYDHGAQYFTARDMRFIAQVAAWRRDGIVSRWDGTIAECRMRRCTPVIGQTERYVGVPGMNAPVRDLARGIEIQTRTSVTGVHGNGDTVRLAFDTGAVQDFDAVVVTVPPAQAAALLPAESVLQPVLAAIAMRPCWAVMVRFATALGLDFDAAFVNSGPLTWICRDDAKPGRDPGERWVLHAAPGWSQDQRAATAAFVVDRLVPALFEATGRAPVETQRALAHRWLYALATDPLDQGCLWDPTHRVAVAGDWCHGSRVEGAYLSGLAASRVVVDHKAVG